MQFIDLKRYVKDPFADCLAEIKNKEDLVTYSGGHRRKLSYLALLAHEPVRCAVMSYRKCSRLLTQQGFGG